MSMQIADIGIVGGGPIGIELAVALKHAGLDYIHWEAAQIGATMQWWAPGTRWFSSPDRIAIAGVPLITINQEKATREEYLAYLRTVVTHFSLKINTYEKVVNVEHEPRGDGFLVQTKKLGGSGQYRVSKLILATGGTAHPKLLNVPGEDLPHVSHYFAEPHTYFQKKLLIVGGRNSAVEAALRCHRAGAEVALSYRGDHLDQKDIKYWLWPEIDAALNRGKIASYLSTELIEIAEGSVRLKHQDGRQGIVPADFVLLMTGYHADMTLPRMLGVELLHGRDVPRFDPATMQTNVPGLFIAGTAIAGTQQKYRIFLENCHVHVERILRSLTGKKAQAADESTPIPEASPPES